jgi:hypothetical protein
MTEPTTPSEVSCPYCGALNARWDGNCWLCKQTINLNPAVADEPILAEPVDVKPQFGLSTLLLIVTLFCLCLGLIAIGPGLIVPIVIIVVPALIRTTVASRVSGGPVSAVDKVASFSASLGIVVLIWIAGLIAFGAACTLIVVGGAALDFSENVVGMLLLLGIGAAIGAFALMIWLLYLSWPRNIKRK